MAGRGTDIKLGEGVKELGGLAVVGTERHESRRIDNQLRGRSGRQGDPGITQFYLSMEDELMRRFGAERTMAMLDRFGMDDSTPIQSKMVSRAVESSQKRVEGNNFDSRKQLLQYDDVLRQRREVIYKRRFEVIDSDNLRDIVEGMIKSSLERAIAAYTPKEELPEEWNLDGLVELVNSTYLDEGALEKSDIFGKEPDEMHEMIMDRIMTKYNEKKRISAKSRCVNLKKSSYCVPLIQNGWIILMRWISRVKGFTSALMRRQIQRVNIKWKASQCLST